MLVINERKTSAGGILLAWSSPFATQIPPQLNTRERFWSAVLATTIIKTPVEGISFERMISIPPVQVPSRTLY